MVGIKMSFLNRSAKQGVLIYDCVPWETEAPTPIYTSSQRSKSRLTYLPLQWVDD